VKNGIKRENRHRQRDRARRLIARVLRSIFAFCLLHFAFCLSVSAQEVVDKMVVSINGRELITYTDLLWQLALQPNTPIDNPRSEDLQRVLNLLIDQRLIAEEAGKLPAIAAKDEDVEKAKNELAKHFPSQDEFRARLQRVGLTNEQFTEIVRQRVEIENYLNFRFRSFVVISPKEIEDYYKNIYVPRWRQQTPGRIVPTLDEARKQLEQTLTESKIESDTDAFLEDARARAEIIILNPV
jgi:hypothetical protein